MQRKSDEKNARVIERPDGFYWMDDVSGKEYGPFTTLLEAMQDMQDTGDSDFGEGMPLDEAEEEIGMSGWVDPETGEPAEETVTRYSD